MGKESRQRLWDREPALWQAAQEVTVTHPVPVGDPTPQGMCFDGTAVNLSTRRLRVSLWGPAEQLTLSLGKSDVWDRRRYYEQPLTLAKIKEHIAKGDCDDDYSYYRSWIAYDFPCSKPVGQIIVRCPGFKGAGQPVAVTHCHDGTTTLEIAHGNVSGKLAYLPMMMRNLIAIQGDLDGFAHALSFRLYRHQDTDERDKSIMGALYSAVPHETPPSGPASLKDYDYSKDTDPDNRPIDPPQAGRDGRFFWIRQQFPAEGTFPQGFEYVMAGLVSGPPAAIEIVDGERGLGTPPFLNAKQQETVEKKGNLWRLMPIYEPIRQAPGSAATATLSGQTNVNCTLFVAVVTSAEASDPLAEAKRCLLHAERTGFSGLVAENEAWFRAFYERREKGRVFQGNADFAKQQIPEVFCSWTDAHHKVCDPDPTRFEAAASYGYLEQDFDPWHGTPCYNELFFTYVHVQNRSDRLNYYYKLVNFWLPACMKNAREVFGLPGAALLHGYLPPILPDGYPHTSGTWEFCMEIPAQVVKCLWDCFDYGGDERFLAETVYPALRETAIFYSAYATLGADRCYHVIPTVSAEHWGWTPNFDKNRDSTSALCMFRWLLNRAAEASEILDRDTDLRDRWREIADRIAPYPTWQTPKGPVFTDVIGVNPLEATYNWFAGLYPTELADEINLDSPAEQREMMLRSAEAVKSKGAYFGSAWNAKNIPPLLAAEKGTMPEQLINSRSGRIHLFPAVPDGATVAFRDMQARGGFEVSAEYVKGKVMYLHVRSHRDVICRIMNPWPGTSVTIEEEWTRKQVSHTLDAQRGECLIFTAKAGYSYLLSYSE